MSQPDPNDPKPDRDLIKKTKAFAPIDRFYAGLNTGDFSVVDEVVAPDYTADFTSGPEGLKQYIRTLHSAFPDIQTTVEDVSETGDEVVVRYTRSGTHLGEYEGILPTNQQVVFEGTDIFRIVGGKIVEQRTSGGDVDLMQQLGPASPPKEREE